MDLVQKYRENTSIGEDSGVDRSDESISEAIESGDFYLYTGGGRAQHLVLEGFEKVLCRRTDVQHNSDGGINKRVVTHFQNRDKPFSSYCSDCLEVLSEGQVELLREKVEGSRN